MSSPNHPTSDIDDAFSSNFPDYIPASPDYVPASSGKTYSSSSNNSFGLAPIASPTLLLFHDDPYMKTSLERHKKQIEEILNHLDELSLDRIENMEDNIEGLGKGQNKSLRKSKLVTKRIRKDSWVQSMNSKSTRKDRQTTKLDSSYMLLVEPSHGIDPKPKEAVARKCSYKEFMSCQPFNLKGSEGAVRLIRWFEHTESVFSRSNCTEDCKVKFSASTLIEEALSWWNSFAQPIGIEEAYKITWVEFKKLLTKKYCPRSEVQKIEDEFYHLTVKGNDLKTYVRRFLELETLCPTMVSDFEKTMEAFIGGLPRSIEGNVTASKPQTLEETINIAQRLMD
nr:reverse transcriptase domain-containing protein [Tanacetum cinerariifolium]